MMTAWQWSRLVCVGALVFGATAGSSFARAQISADKAPNDTVKAEPEARASVASDPKRAKLIADTRRMLALSHEVQAEMAKNGPSTLSLGLVKKVEELQKLAAVVKAEMGKVP